MPTNDIRIKRLYDTMARHYNMTEPFEDFADKFTGSEQARRKVYDAMTRHYNMTESFEDFSKIATDGSFSGSQTRLNSSDDKKYQKQKITQENASGYSQIGSNDKHTDKVYKETEAKEENKPARVSATGPAKRDPVLLAEEDFKRSKDSLLSRLFPSGDENFYTKLSEKEREAYWQRYQELEDNYKSEKKTSKEWAKANTWIKDELKEQRKEERKDKWENLGKGLIRSIAYPAGTATGSPSYMLTAGDTPAQAQAKEWAEPYMKEYRESKAVARVLDESVKLFNAAEKGKGVGRGIIDDMAKIQTWDLGFSDMSHAMTLGTLYEKEERGEPLTATENEVLDAVAIASYVTEQVSPAVKRGYNVGASLPQSLGFMFSLYINPASGLGKTIASRAIRRYGRRGVSKLTTRAIGTGARVFGDIAEMGIATATSGSGRVLAEAIERVNGSPTYEISPEGFVVYGGQRDKEEFGRAYAKAFGSNFIENWSEAVGDYFLPLIKPLDITLKNVIDVKLRKNNLNGIADFLNSVPKSQLAGMVNDFKERTKFSGLIGEILEEEIGMLIEPLLIGDTTLKENFGVWSKDPQIREIARDNQLTTIFSCALMSGALGAVQVAGGRVAAKMDKDVRKAHQEGQRLFKKDWTDIKDRIDEAEPDQVVSITKDIVFNPNLSVEQRKAVVVYAYKRMINQQYNTTAKLARDEMTQTAQTLLTAYDAGYRMATASHPKGIRKAYIEAIEAAEALQQYDKEYHTDLFSTAEKLLTADIATRQMTLDGLGREQSELVEDYLAKTLRQTGIEDGTTDDVQYTVEAAVSALDPVTTHDEQGNPVIISALTADDRVVYITGEQDKMSTVTYEDTNETTVYPTDQLKDHVVQRKEDVINEFEAQIRERSRARLTHYSQHNDKTQPIQKGLVIGDGDAKIIVTDTGAGWATIQEAETDKESDQIVPKKDAPTRDVTHDYLLSLQDDIYDHRDMMDGMNQMAQMVAQEIKQAQQDTGVAPSDQEALRSRIAEWEERTGVKAIIATTIDEVTSKSAQKAITEGRIVNAWYEVETDRVGFYLPYIASVKEIDTGYMHEVVSHKGLRELLGQEKFDTFMDAVWRDLMTEEDRAHYLHYNRHLNLEGADAQRAAADEYVAHVAESVDTTEPMSNIIEAWNKIVEYVRGILEELGLVDNTLTNDELSDVIKASLLNYEHKQLQTRQLSEQQAQAQAEQQAKAQEQAGEEALSKIPPIQNKQGETIDYDWVKAPDIETALTAMRHLGYTNQDIVQFALTYTNTLVGRHKKLEKSTPKSLPEQKAKRENIQAVTQELSFWRGVRDQIQKETTPEIESRPREVQEQTNTEGIEGIAKRFNEGKRTRGIETTVILADGTEISGHYELTEAGDVTASHNPETFEQSEGFPTNENGSTVNDRDYKHDKAAQEAVKLKGQSYDKRAYQEPVIVSPDGVVYSGNDRTMAGIIAANNGADVKYNESLRQDIAQYGFTEEQFNEYKHPRLVFVTDETLPYTTETFARFNASERKSQDSIEKMVKSGKTTSDVTFQRLSDLVQMYDDVFEMYNKGGVEIINLLIKEGVITSNDAAQYLDGDKLSRTGQEFVESLIMGYLFNQNDQTVRMLFADGMGNVRKAIIGSLSQLIANRTMGEYSIQPEMEQAIEICYRAHRDHKGSVEGYLSQINLFTDDVNSKESSELAQLIALSINTGSVRLRGALDAYNKSFANDVGAVAGVFGKRTRDEALQDLTNYLKRYDTEGKTGDVPEGITGDRRDDTGSSDQSGADDRGAAETAQRGTDTDSPADNEESRGEQVLGVEAEQETPEDTQDTQTPIQGLDGYTTEELEANITNWVEDAMSYSSPSEFTITGVKVVGSRTTDTAHEDSDLDVLVEYEGSMSEDGVFNILNAKDGRMVIEGITVDFNPLNRAKSGTISDWLERNKEYKREDTQVETETQPITQPINQPEQGEIEAFEETASQREADLETYQNKVFGETVIQEKEENVQEAKTQSKETEEVKETNETLNKSELQDVGEKIGGARKDLAQSLKKVNDDDLSDKPLSKIFPRPDFNQLVKDGILTKEAATLLSYLYDNLPAKPRLKHRKKAWVGRVRTLIDTMEQLLNDENQESTARTMSESLASYNMRFASYAKTIEALGEITNLKGYSVRESTDGRIFITKESTIVADGFKSFDEAAQRLKEILSKPTTKRKGTTFGVWSNRVTGEVFIGKKTGRNINKVMSGFKTVEDARKYLKENQAELDEIWDKMKTIASERRSENSPRVGPDYRKGKNVSSKDFKDTFGFRGVEFGNWVNTKERQAHINEAYDALMDLTHALNIDPRALSLNGQLAFAFGARGKGKANAHYETDKVVINLTKTKGAGSLAHEWWHALDNYFSRMRGKDMDYLTERPRALIDQKKSEQAREQVIDDSVRVETILAIKGIVDAINKSGLAERSDNLDKTRSKPYWGTMVEMTARAFENFIIQKLSENNHSNDYLANLQDLEGWVESGMETDSFPYPNQEESQSINEAIQHLFDIIQQRETEDGNVALFQRGTDNFKAISKKAFKGLVNRLNRALGGKNKIITSEKEFRNALKKAGLSEEQVQQIQDSSGTIFGAILPDGTIYLNENNLNANTPFHEIVGHLFLNNLKKTNPKAYNEIIEKLKAETDLMDQVRNDPAYAHLTTDEQIADELFARMVGDKGEQLFNQMQSRSLSERIKSLIDKFWQNIKKWIGNEPQFKNINNWTPEQFRNATIGDIIDNLTKEALAGKQIISELVNERQSNEVQYAQFLQPSDLDKNAGIKVKSADDNIGTFDTQTDDIRFRDVYGGNSGYIGYSMSRRAAQARSEGRYPKTDFKKVYGLSEKVFKRLADAGVLNDSEWHHTSMYGNRTTFYSWDGDHYHNIYEQNRDRVDKLIADNKLDELHDFFYNEDRRITEEWENSTERRTEKARTDIAREYNRYEGTQVNMLTKDVYEASNGMTVVPKHVGNYKDVSVEVGGIELTRKSGGEERRKAIREYRDYIESNILPYSEWLSANMENIGPILEKHGITESDLISSIEDDVRFRERTDAPPKNIGKAYKVFKLFNGKLYPPMVANPNAEHTPMGVWLDADASPVVGTSKTGRPQVKAAGGGRLAFRPGWHLSTIPYASQFNRKDADGNMTLFPATFVWAEVEYAKDIDYQKEAMSYGISESGKFRHSYAGLPRIPENGSYLYRTNPNPKTDAWIITGAMKVNKLLTPSQVDALVIEAGREPQTRQDGFITSEQIRAFNRVNKAVETGDNTLFRVIGEIGVSRLDGAEKILDNLRVAKQMEIRPDISLNEIKLTTGWERGADRKWRYEQPDGKPITENLYSPEDGVMTTHESDEDAADIANAPKLSEVWDDAELFKAYPKIADIKVIGIYGHVVDKPLGIYGTEKGVKVINAVAPDADAWRTVIVHEIQHAIQDIEGFARGGDNSIIERVLVSARDTQTAETLNPYTAYRRLAGEVEARNVSRRRDFTAEERRRMLLEDSEDVERSQQIVLRGVAEDTMFREADNAGAFDAENNDIRFRKTDASGFYSTVEDALEKIKQEKGTPEQFKAMLLKNGAKQAELDYMDFDGTFTGKSITKTDIQDWIDQNRIEVQEVEKGASEVEVKSIEPVSEKYATVFTVTFSDNSTVEVDLSGKYDNDPSDISEREIAEEAQKLRAEDDLTYQGDEEINPTKYSQYQEPGGKNYKELLLTMPDKSPKLFTTKVIGDKWFVIDSDGKIASEPLTAKFEAEEIAKHRTEIESGKKINTFKSSHFDEPNILAHVRFNVRTMPNGEKVLFIEEIQSDWAQEGKKKGFYNSSDGKRITELADLFLSDRSKNQEGTPERIEYERLVAKNKIDGVPDMPFKKTDQWVNLALRRMMRYAAENGFDRIAWTNGEQQAARYDLSKQVDDIYTSEYGEEWTSRGYEKRKDVEITLKGGEVKKLVVDDSGKIVSGDYVGERLENVIGKEITEKILSANIDTNFGQQDLKVGGEGMKAFYDAIVPSAAKKLAKPFGAKVEQIELPLEAKGQTFTVQSIPVTDKMYESVMQGVPLYKMTEELRQKIGVVSQAKLAVLRSFFDNVSKEAVNAVDIVVVDSRNELPQELQNKMPDDLDVQGFYYTGDNKAYFILNEIQRPELAFRTWVHEVGVHAGLRSIIPARDFSRLMRKIYNDLGQDEIRRVIPKVYWGDDIEEQAEEYLAFIGEKIIKQEDLSKKEQSIWNKIVDSFLDVLNKLFKNGRFTKQDAESLVMASVQNSFWGSNGRISGDLFSGQSGQTGILQRNDRTPATTDSGAGEGTIFAAAKDYLRQSAERLEQNTNRSVNNTNNNKNEEAPLYRTKNGRQLQFNLLSDQEIQDQRGEANNTGTRSDDIQRKGSAEPDTRNIRTEAGAGALIRPLRKLEKGEMCFVQRKMSEDKNFSFTGANQIESTEDVAYIFKQLENKAIENAFLVFIKDGKATVLHVGMGNLSSTSFDTAPIVVMLSNIKPDTVYMVHNHPSGKVVASDQDHKTYNSIKGIVKTYSPKTKLGEGIIIDTKSGIYGIFGERPTEKKEAAKKPLYETNIPVYKFDELAFSKDYDPLKLTRIMSSLDIANFVATHRLGERDKVNILCINTSGHVVGNFFTDITTLKSDKDAERLARLCAEYVGMTGARSVAVFGSGVAPASAAKGAELKYWHNFRYAARNMQVNLLDIISVDNLYGTHSSYANNDLMETTAAYGEQEREESTEGEDVRFNETRRERKERLESDWELLKKEQGLAVANYDRRLANTAVKVYEATTDNCRSVKELQKAVTAETGKTLKSYENVYWLKLDETSRTQPAQWNFARFFYEPLTDEVRRIIQSNTTGIVGYRKAYKELSEYLMAKHGLERNDKFAMRDAQKAFEAYEKAHPNTGKTVEDFYADFRKRDYSGLTALTDKKKTEDAEAMAQAMVEAYESANDTKELWRLINRSTKEILRISYNGSMISKQTYIDLVTMFDYYIPLRGFDETTSDEVYSYVGTVNSPYNTAIKSARGRRSRAEDPLATIGNMADSEIINVHKNVAKRALLSLAENHRTNLLSVSEVMYVKDANTGNWVMSMPLFDDGDTAEEVTAKMIEHRHWFAAQMMIDPDNYKMDTDAINIPYKVVSSKALSEHQVLVTRGGQKYIVTINGNPRAAQAINGKLNPDAYYSALSPIRAVNRFMAKMFTQYNPEFVFSNLTRDGHYANTMVWVRENRDYAKDYNKNWVVSFKDTPRLLHKYKNGTLDTSVPIERYYKEFIEHGGETGYTRLLSVTDYKKQMERKLRGASRHSPLEVANKVVGGYLDTIEDLNRWAEGVSRFAAFLTSRVHGRDIIRSVNDAKEITVNFNRKGAGTALMKAGEKNAAAITAALVTQFGREGYVFFNASIQALDNYAKAGKKNPGKFTSLVIGNIMTGFVMAMLYGDDDDYLNLPPYVRRNNLCAKVDGKWVTIPLSHEHRGFFGLGELAYMVMSGREFYDDNELMTEILSQFSQMLPVDFLESNEADLVMTMMPTSVRPAVEAYVNKDWTGSPIYSDSPYNEHDPEWRKAFRYTSPTLVSATRKLSDATGGSVGRGGSINLNPAIIEHLFESYLGGVGTTFNKAYKTVRAIAGDKQMQEIRNVPVVSRFVRQTDGQAAARAENSRYYDVRDYVEGITNEERRLRQMAAEKVITGFDYDADDIEATIQKLQELRASNKWAFVQRWKALDKARSAAQEAGEEEQMYNITKQANDLYKELRRSKMEDKPVGTTK